jgi:hypothetical protein
MNTILKVYELETDTFFNKSDKRHYFAVTLNDIDYSDIRGLIKKCEKCPGNQFYIGLVINDTLQFISDYTLSEYNSDIWKPDCNVLTFWYFTDLINRKEKYIEMIKPKSIKIIK